MKLIRDKMPDLAKSEGHPIKTRTAKPEERWSLLKAKLLEDVRTFCETKNASEEETDGLIDVIEVMRRICDDLELSEPGKIQALYDKRLEDCGELGFVVMLDDGDK